MNAKNILLLIEKLKPVPKFSAKKFISLHSKKQKEYIKSPTRTTMAYGAKRSGKTLASTSLMVIMDHESPTDARIEIASATLEKSRLLYWRNLQKINKNLNLKYEFHSGRSTIVTPRREIVFRSLRDMANANKAVGFSVLACFIDEIHTCREEIVKHYLNNVIRINTLNIPGARINITCNPPVFPLPWLTQQVYENPEVNKIHFLPEDNPWITKKVLKQFIKDEAKELGYKSVEEALEKSNELKRNILGLWVADTGRIIFNEKKVAFYDQLPDGHKSYECVVGVDVGGGQSKDAIVAIIYNKYERKAWVAEELEIDSSDQDIEELATNVKRFYEKYKPHSIAFDTGGLGNRLAVTLRTRYGIPGVVPAIKQDKMAWLEIMKAEVQRWRLLFGRDSQLVKEFPQIIYTTDKLEVDDINGLHSDLLDACLYSFRFVYNAWPAVKPVKESYKQKRLKEILKKNKKRGF